ncbi:hypothetical protein BsWGS_15416 [Bradybaena similaris]
MAAPRQAGGLTLVVADMLQVFFTCCLVELLVSAVCSQYSQFQGFLLCRKCGFEIAKAEDLVSIASEAALRQRNDTFGSNHTVLIQLFRNPQDIYFEVITCLHSAVEKSHERYITDSWFPGYSWSIAKCPHCSSHVGWSFHAVNEAAEGHKSKVLSFVGLILDKIMHEDEASNLIVMPKTYTS